MKHPHDCTLGCQGMLNAEHELRRDLAGMARQADSLRAENARLRAALEAVVKAGPCGSGHIRTARAALSR